MLNCNNIVTYLDVLTLQVAPTLSNDSAEYVHHALVYVCDGLEGEDLGPGGNCDTNVSSRVLDCLASSLIGAWAVGGTVSRISLVWFSIC